MKVLFICVANINRSQIAEAIFNSISKKNHAVSAGIMPHTEGILVKDERNNPFIPMRNAGYDLSHAKARRLNKAIVEDADKIVLSLNKKHLKEIPPYLQDRRDFEHWEIDSISDELTFEEYCKLEEMRIRQIEKRVRDLVGRIG